MCCHHATDIEVLGVLDEVLQWQGSGQKSAIPKSNRMWAWWLKYLGRKFRGALIPRAYQVAQLLKDPPAVQKTLVWFLGWEDPLEKDRLPIPVFLGFPNGSDGKESSCNAGDLSLIRGLDRSPGGGHGSPLQNSCLENPHEQRNLAGAVAHGLAKNRIWLSDATHRHIDPKQPSPKPCQKIGY